MRVATDGRGCRHGAPMSRRRGSGDASYPSVYKHPSLPRKQQLCAICTLKTRGSTVEVHLTHGVVRSSCAPPRTPRPRSVHANGGRDLAHLLSLVWQACNQLNATAGARWRPTSTDLARAASRDEHALPGSYDHKATRNEAEHRYADGDDPRAVSRELRDRHAHDVADPPSDRTLRRWFADGRWRRGMRTPLRPGFDASRSDHRRTRPRRRPTAAAARPAAR